MKEIIKLVVVIGTRPEAIKLAPIIWAAHANGKFSLKIIRTGQHRELVDPLMNELGLVADANLDVMKPNQQLSYVLSESVRGLSDFFVREEPDWVLVQGDTTSALAGALAGFYNSMRVGHVEAGLRTGDRNSPYPEEVNRALISRVADLHFVPTERARSNLLREAIASEDIVLTGNTVVDAMLTGNTVVDAMLQTLKRPPMNKDGQPENYVLVTIHRRENFGRGLAKICDGLIALLKRNQGLRAIIPVHSNPKVRDVISERLGDHSHVILREPLSYTEFVHVLKHSRLVLTDSGGVQEECAVLGKPVLVARRHTERQEAVEAGVAILVGADPERILEEGTSLLKMNGEMVLDPRLSTIFGDGNAAGRILQAVLHHASRSDRRRGIRKLSKKNQSKLVAASIK
jgi:UDP-N-acetylglucosamine 2-epimerase (non-hydrolysing)